MVKENSRDSGRRMWMWSTTMPSTAVRGGSSIFKLESPKVFDDVAPQIVSN